MDKTRNNTEKAIMQAAEELFLEHGFKLTTTTMIARRAGVTHAMLHYYFRTKELIFTQVLDKYMSGLLASLKPVMTGGGSFMETLERAVSMHFDFIDANRQLPAFLYDVARQSPQLLEKYREKVRHEIGPVARMHAEMLDKEIRAGRIRPVEPSQLLFDIVSMNVSTFMALPLLQGFTGMSPEEAEDLLARRKQEILETIRLRLAI